MAAQGISRRPQPSVPVEVHRVIDDIHEAALREVRHAAREGADVAVAVIGLGPWGLSVLERLIEVARHRRVRTVIHVVDPSAEPGSGIFDVNQPDYLLLNTPCGQHVIHPAGHQPESHPYAQSLFHWARAEGYKWVGPECRISPHGEDIAPHDFLPRRVMGEWLQWSYRRVVGHRPGHVCVLHHPNLAVDVERSADGREVVVLDDGNRLLVDHVIITSGHTPQAPPDPSERFALPPYPVSALHSAIDCDDTVAVAGLGLVALDVIAALTLGRGGSFEDAYDGLRYRPSGYEPRILLFSRSGHPYAAKAVGASDPTGEYVPLICTPERIRRLRAPDGHPTEGCIDFRKDVLPLLIAEMEVRFFRQMASVVESPAAGEEVSAELARAWSEGRFSAVKQQYAARYGYFDFERHILGEAPGKCYESGEDYQKQVYKIVQEDLAEAMNQGMVSPVKAAYETLRVLRDEMRSIIEFGGLTLESYIDFQSTLSNRLKAAVAGPPARRAQELLALIDAGVVRMPWGPSPEVEPTDGPAFVIRSTRLMEPCVLEVDHLVHGHLDEPTIAGTLSPLIRHLAERGRIRTFRYGEVEVGSLDLTPQSQPRDAQGQPQDRIWVFGCLTEGVRYFTQYVPSPKSRVRAFLDAEECAERIFSG